MTKKLNVLFLCNKPEEGSDANTIVDHIDAFKAYSKHHIWVYSNLGKFSRKLDLDRFDVVIIHYSIFILSSTFLRNSAKKKLRDYQGMKVIFIQDEYRRINEMVSTLAYLDVDVLFTCFPESEFERIYPSKVVPKLSKYNNLTGYIPERLTLVDNQPLIKERPVHVGYRGRKLPFWYGELGCDKWNIVEKWHEHVPESLGFKVNISAKETDRIYGKDWVNFLTSSKATLGVESGASVMDFTGRFEKAVDKYQLLHPQASFEAVRKKFFDGQEGLHKLNQISPRCFEAIALKTALILYEGEYSGILEPGRHYIELKKDFSNIESVLTQLKDDDFLQTMVDRAFEEVALNPKYSYKTFIGRVDDVLSYEFVERKKQMVVAPYTANDFAEAIGFRTLQYRFMTKTMKIYRNLPFGARLLVKVAARPHHLPRLAQKLFYMTLGFIKKNKQSAKGTST